MQFFDCDVFEFLHLSMQQQHERRWSWQLIFYFFLNMTQLGQIITKFAFCTLCNSIVIQGVLALCEFHYREFRYCGFSKPLLKICLVQILCTINFVTAIICLMRFLSNGTFSRFQKSHKARTLCIFLAFKTLGLKIILRIGN